VHLAWSADNAASNGQDARWPHSQDGCATTGSREFTPPSTHATRSGPFEILLEFSWDWELGVWDFTDRATAAASLPIHYTKTNRIAQVHMSCIT
jgi:hypothetical protein